MSEKTEKPTPKKVRDAREQGQIAKSMEVATGVQLAMLLGYFWWRAEDMIDAFQIMIEVSIASLTLPLRVAMDQIMDATIGLALNLLAPMALMLLLGTVTAIVTHIGPLFAPKFIQPKGERISPLKNAKQLFSMRSLFEFGKSLLKVSILAITFYLLLKQHLNAFQFLPLCGIECGLRVTGVVIGILWGILVLFYVLFAIADLAYQKRSLTKQLMMSRDEIIKEYKNTEGDPHVRHKRKELHRELQSGSMNANVRRSTAVVRNPTHVAVCLYFVAGETPLPQVIEKGTDARARQLIAIAEEAGVPIVEAVYLARRLNATTEIGDFIPAELFEPVAEVLHLVSEIGADRSADDEEDIADEEDGEEEAEEAAGEAGDERTEEEQNPDPEAPPPGDRSSDPDAGVGRSRAGPA
ncbi:EscU/YscU/HrcU family type III secretion system export apparatus switch protein [Cupriavidus sp. AU9028]|uniref:EscU/YscU/HrcU family type III secretion system export apparatus switch protein n=1 Tax=Cupriavidus sp. AU9028 TaxID=2871157 RepID=UPI001C943467|nr:EscU/YscU/HrcU family type III secretion system export apparatus switch protein [Cupriavidus sp. AU9028]MBY4897885.1 EscU/YscU/HrcU family type III secretion system export apparatus switch protein [Cupriavidus sp. AU9028]